MEKDSELLKMKGRRYSVLALENYLIFGRYLAKSNLIM